MESSQSCCLGGQGESSLQLVARSGRDFLSSSSGGYEVEFEELDAKKDGFADSEKNKNLLILVVVIAEKMQVTGNELWWARVVVGVRKSPSSSAAGSSSVPRSPRRAETLVLPGSRRKKGKLLGRGTFGHVYVGFNRESGEMCAIKEVTLFADDAKSRESAKQLEQVRLPIDCRSLVVFVVF
ncbi:hypothetical protein C5167_034801 [Papaver somniferum]|uniref:mitogen-activated protein kinase kinase kinase n=1 Tax=Papaver somniferum TaxID=3469 RepID=A0A4Y7KGZ5_PAPSO|nr:hypothetical protein C5167_034801 [Papaver somniferum]